MNRNVLFSKLFTAAIAMIMLTACSSGENEGAEESAGNSSANTVDTKFGEVDVPEEPQRVVALGWGDAETALALGVEPVGASDWLDFGGDGVGPWMEDSYEESPEIIGTMEPDYEQIAALQPDLILDTKSSGDEERYDRLSDIATTVGVPEGADNYLTSMEDQVQMIATALHREDEGEALLQEVDTAFEQAAEENPQFEGQTITVAAYDANGFGAYVEGDSRIDFVRRLGFETKDEIEALAEDSFYVSLSDEQLELLDADLTVVLPIGVDRSQITDNQLYQQIPSVADGRSVVLDSDLSNAFSTGTVPSILWAIDNVTPELAEVLEDEE
ncbi:iron-siderophore ABC transporter substrate-binding protein [Salinicoccus albus]|uniref:iron-siderophore ABC transporter substrate-binding protein n=1 Tax=Salinicoccus albus TaxID=418756 RepID=UPI00036A7989|nr:iron-siderophore ABC transporter substrate-binding protein [Salinicoccus albus]